MPILHKKNDGALETVDVGRSLTCGTLEILGPAFINLNPTLYTSEGTYNLIYYTTFVGDVNYLSFNNPNNLIIDQVYLEDNILKIDLTA